MPLHLTNVHISLTVKYHSVLLCKEPNELLIRDRDVPADSALDLIVKHLRCSDHSLSMIHFFYSYLMGKLRSRLVFMSDTKFPPPPFGAKKHPQPI